MEEKVEKIDPKRDRYPKVEAELKLVGQTLEALRAKGPTVAAAAPKRFSGDDLDIFEGASTSDSSAMTGAGPGLQPKSGSGDKDAASTAVAELPEYCLVRLLDVSVMPGKRYKYKLRVRMANPNYKRTDVASVKYAEEEELPSEWTEIPTPVSIKPDLYYYAVDEKELNDGKQGAPRYKGPLAYEQINKDRELIMQAHRWVESVRLKTGANLIIGEWAVAERFRVERGEYVGRTEKVEVPYWKYQREDFVITSELNARKPGIEVDFTYRAANAAQPEAILIDFDSGKSGYERVIGRNEDKPEIRRVADGNAVEAVLLNPDGKLVLLEGAEDIINPDRTRRCKEVRERLNEVRGLSKGAKGKDSPFGE